jgi:1-acyl-sn-glycerol-3-phosphate acyltransferase
MADIVEYRWAPSLRLYRLTRRLFAPPLTTYFHLTYHGAEHIPGTGAVVLACNHLSNLDPVLLAAACPRPINYLAKIELFHVPILGSLIRRYGAIPLRRSASDPEAIRLAEQVLEHEQVLALFPEGTRSRTGQFKPFRFGAARLALKYNIPLIPAAISGTDRAMPSGVIFPRRATVRIAFGSAIDTAPYRYSRSGGVPEVHLIESVTNLLQGEVQRLKEMIEESV